MSHPQHHNNFDALRIFAALLVVYYHSWPLFGHAGEPFNGLFPFETPGGLAVSVFFFISGHLITGSLLRDASLARYARSRAVRILPALAASVIFCAFVIGPLMTTLSLPAYVSSGETWGYLRNMSVFLLQGNLPGVFAGLPLAGAVNGSLWTLPIEVTCYILLYGLCRLNMLTGLRPAYTAVLFVAAFLMSQTWLGWSWASLGPDVMPSVKAFNLLQYGSYFMLGSLFMTQRARIPVHGGLAVCALVLFIAAARLPGGQVLEIATLPYLVYWLAYADIPVLRFPRLTGDMSYGIYIFSFPLQQVICQSLVPSVGFAGLMALSLAASIAAGFASWHLIEKPALRFKRSAAHPVGGAVAAGAFVVSSSRD